MKKIAIILFFLLAACGQNNSLDGTASSSNCLTCFAEFKYIGPSDGGITITTMGVRLWQTTDGTNPGCSSSTPLPAGFTCDSIFYDCANPTFVLSNSTSWCQQTIITTSRNKLLLPVQDSADC